MINYKIKIPCATNVFVKELRSVIGLTSEPIILQTKASIEDEPCGCFENVRKRVASNGGELVLGWQFWEHPYMIEAEFHAVWRNIEGELIDITPKDAPEINTILFVLDEVRKYDGTQTDNVRLNTTSCGLVDDIIEVEKAKYRFLNKDGRDKVIGQIIFKEDDALIWQSIMNLSAMLEHLHLSGGDINFDCFCNSGKSYAFCHREIVQKGMLEI